MQLDQPERGFSFLREGPLDMRFDPASGASAAELVNTLSEQDLRELFWRFGEEPRARKIAAAIIELRPIETTTELATLIEQLVGRSRKGTHPATRTFQALRIAVNDELGQLQQGLQAAVQLLAPGGRLAVIAFHSLEDRMVKTFFREQSRACICPPEAPVCTCDHQPLLELVNRRAIKANEEEIAHNPRARSARLRVAQVLQLA
jgi:16S rRNA (cytosine1402-N4)-methyltransferase